MVLFTLGMVHQKGIPKELAVTVSLLPKILLGLRDATFNVGDPGLSLSHSHFGLVPAGLHVLGTLDECPHPL